MREKKEFKNHWIFLLAGILFFIEACIPFLGGGGPSIVIQSSKDSSEDENSSRRRVRKSRRELSSEFFAKTQADECRESKSCERICLNLYDDNYGAQDECLKLKKEAVDDLDAIVGMLEDPTVNELLHINHKIFEVFLGLSVEPWVEALRNADRDEAGPILAWVAQSKDISSVILEHGSTGDYAGFKSYEGLKELLKAVSRTGSTDCAQFKSGFEEELNDSGFSFCEIAVRESNTKVTSQNAESGILGDFLRGTECGNCWRVLIVDGSCTFAATGDIEDSTVCNTD